MQETQEKRCWICLAEEVEENDRWVAPCHCKGSVKFTHENCLLRWIYEKQQDSETVTCQSCGYAYVIQEPFNPVLSVMNSINSAINFIVPLGVCQLTLTGVFASSAILGGFMFFTMTDEKLKLFRDESLSFQITFGFPSIPILLILSRFSIPDPFFIGFPILMFPPKRFPLMLSWPPSPVTTVYALPWIRLVYNRLVESLSKWDLEREKRKYAGTFQIATLQEEESQGKSILRLSLGALSLPFISTFVGSILGSFPWIEKTFPSRFHKSILGGFVTVILKDVSNFIYRKIIRYQRRQRRIKNYH